MLRPKVKPKVRTAVVDAATRYRQISTSLKDSVDLNSQKFRLKDFIDLRFATLETDI